MKVLLFLLISATLNADSVDVRLQNLSHKCDEIKSKVDLLYEKSVVRPGEVVPLLDEMKVVLNEISSLIVLSYRDERQVRALDEIGQRYDDTMLRLIKLETRFPKKLRKLPKHARFLY